jgi:ribonuclease R
MDKKKTTKSKNSSQTKILKGKLDISRSGMGFVIVEDQEKDIIVKPNDFGKAFHGDTVRVQIATGGGLGTKRVEGKIIDVVERKQVVFLGNLQVTKTTAFFKSSSLSFGSVETMISLG